MRMKSIFCGNLLLILHFQVLSNQKCNACLSRPRTGKVITTHSGQVRGSIGRSRDGREFYQFFKIPYAQPPVGPLRFATPKPVEKWEGILDGRRPGPWCAHVEPFWLLIFGEEDCLHLNIFVPKKDTRENLVSGSNQLLPVIVWIHGGTFMSGSALEYGAEYFMDENIVFISINYRLGLLGFLTTADKEIRGNMGLKDQVEALKWIKENVEFFGGDASKITVMGESAGAVSVHYLTLSSSTKGLFQKAISMSGVATVPWACQSSKSMSVRTKAYAVQLNCPTQNSTALTQCLRQIGVTDLLQAFRWDTENLFSFHPTKRGDLLPPVVESVDDDEAFITKTPYDIITQGQGHRIPWLTGIVADEGLLTSLAFKRDPTLLTEMENNWDQNSHFVLKLGTIPEEDAMEIRTKLRQFYFGGKNTTTNTTTTTTSQSNSTETIDNHTKLYTDSFFLAPLSQTADIQRRFSPVFLYLFNKTGGPSFTSILTAVGSEYPFQTVVNLAIKYGIQFGLRATPKNYGVSHVDDILLLFPMRGLLKIAKNDQDEIYKFSKKFVHLVTQFATDESSMIFEGIPFPPNLADGKPLKYFNLNDDPSQLGMIDEPFQDRLQIWRQLNVVQKQSEAIKSSMGVVPP